MRNRKRWAAAAALAALAGVAGCEPGTRAQEGDPDVQAPGYAEDLNRGTTLNDTTPARPEAPSVIPGEGVEEGGTTGPPARTP